LNLFGTIAEYNPFHNGHKYHLNEMKKAGATHIVVAMSGNFVQRGECAIYPKHERARAALKNGADLVIEIPSFFSMSSAQSFAYAGVVLLDALNVRKISFGSESGDIEKLKAVAEAISDSDFENKLLEKLSTGMTYAAARESALRDISGELADIIKTPNNILGIEYINAINKISSDIEPTTISRLHTQHDSSESLNGFISASELRKKIKNREEVSEFLPYTFNSEPASVEQFEKMILYKLRTMSIKDLSKLPDVSEGLENRIYTAVKETKSLDELYEKIKSKRYTHSRIRRIVLSAFLGFEKNMFDAPKYIRVLGLNEKGREILRAVRKTAKLPIIMKYSDVTDTIRDMFELESICTDIYSLANNEVCGKEMTENVIIL